MARPPGRPLAPADQLILDAATGARTLSDDELSLALAHVARAGFDPNAVERVRGRLTGFFWRGRALKGIDRLPPAEVHYVWHVLHNGEWPAGTSLQEYLASVHDVVLDPATGVFTSRFQMTWQLGVIREARELTGPAQFSWVLVEYRVDTGHWVTAFQPRSGLRVLQLPGREDLRWLRPLPPSSAP